jgi:hypothetical protein
MRQGNASLCRSVAFVATRAAGRIPMRGPARPSAEIIKACLAPRVWVWGVWFGLALRCVALLCGVFVRLHLALFPAGGPFLSSLSANLYRTTQVDSALPSCAFGQRTLCISGGGLCHLSGLCAMCLGLCVRLLARALQLASGCSTGACLLGGQSML